MEIPDKRLRKFCLDSSFLAPHVKMNCILRLPGAVLSPSEEGTMKDFRLVF